MNSTIVGICLNGITVSTEEYTIGYSSPKPSPMIRGKGDRLRWMRVDYAYAYDDRGNITSVNMYEYSEGDLGEATYVINYGYNDPSWPDLMTSYMDETITYDDLGNPQNWVWGETLTWENGRQLSKYEGYENTVNYTYNADGLRTSKSGDRTTEYFIANGQYLGEVTKVGYMTYVVAYLYDENGSPAGLNVNGSEFFFVKNIQGDVLGILNSHGTLSVTYRYDAYGNTISMKNGSGEEITNPQAIANVNPFRYRGYMYDIESGYYYLRSRYYDPSVGRFLSADGLVSTGTGLDGYNMFAYCGNNPIVNVDNSGTRHVRGTDGCGGYTSSSRSKPLFGAVVTATARQKLTKDVIVSTPAQSPVLLNVYKSTSHTETISGNEGVITFFADGELSDYFDSSAGARVALGDIELERSVSFNNFGMSFGASYNEQSAVSLALDLDLENFTIGAEFCNSVTIDGTFTTTHYNLSGNGIYIMLVVAAFVAPNAIPQLISQGAAA